MTELVEKPANAVIDKLRNGAALDDADCARLAYYVATMIRRVPLARAKAFERAPKVLADTAREVRACFEELARIGRIDAAMLQTRLAETDAAEKKFQQNPPANVVELIETPWPLSGMLNAIFNMTWRFVSTEGPSFFLTSDNPAFFFEAYGLGTELSELIFPICGNLALHCSWQVAKKTGILAIPQKMVKEFNRRIGCGADRFIFYHEERDWILEVAKNQPNQLNRIVW